MSEQDQRCGTCKFWSDKSGSWGAHYCTAKMPAAVSSYEATNANEGTTCPCWEAKE